MNQVIGSCSLCGGDVVGFCGVWMAVTPPPPARCSACGAVEQRLPVIPMRPARVAPTVNPVRRVEVQPFAPADYPGTLLDRTGCAPAWRPDWTWTGDTVTC